MRFTHLRDDYGSMFATVANDDVTFGATICSDKCQFSRKKGRSISENRLVNGYSVVPDSPVVITFKGEEVFATDVVELFVSNLHLAPF